MGCCSLFNSQSGRYIKFYVILVLDLIDVFVDWYFYAKVKFIKPGLVYGPPEESYKWAVFSFCVISIITLFIETIQNADDLRDKKRLPFLTQSLSNVLTIYLEDIPLLVLNLILSVCRDGEVSIISLIKASLGISAVLIRFILMIVQRWIMDKKKTRFELFCDVISTFGLIVIACLSITIQLLNTFPSDKNGLLQFKSPEKFDRMSFIQEKYLDSVSVFMSWPPNRQNQNNTNQILLGDITNLIKHGHMSIKFLTNSDLNELLTEKNYTLCIQKKLFSLNKTLNCYQVTNGVLFSQVNSTIVDLESLPNGFYISIKKVSTVSFMYRIGYLDFNIKFFNSNETCNQFEFGKSTRNMLTYARYIYPQNETQFFKAKTTHYSTCYNLNYDLITTDKLWRTGILNCDSKADKGPKFNSNLFINCII